ncbi:MAG TPA: hypothetical protein VJU87_10215 [Gemmatimonadaceae bacterium]|nr:hypothetical protein [Gemmatimonadaceae bacterium]
MRTSHRRIALLGLALVAGCGAIEGDVYGAGSAASRRLPDVDVLLVPASDSLLDFIQTFCQQEKADAARRDVERARLDRRAQQLRDSAGVIFGLEYQSARWQQVMSAAKAAADSSAGLSIAGADPVSLAERYAIQHARTDSAGHYQMQRVRAGRYFVVPVTRESEFAAVQWYPSRVRIGTARVDATERDGWAGCYLSEMDSYRLSSNH